MRSINISLPDSMRDYVEEQVGKGNYSTVSEYFRELVRQDQKRKAQEHLEAIVMQGLGSGAATPITAQDWEDIRQAVSDTISKR